MLDMRRSTRRRATAAAVLAVLAALAGCGLDVVEPDLFAVTRTGEGKTLTMLVNYGGTITCDGHAAKTLPDRLLLVARALTGQLAPDAAKKLDVPSTPHSVYRFTIRLQAGTIAFPDTSAAHRPELAQFLQFALAAEQVCGTGG